SLVGRRVTTARTSPGRNGKNGRGKEARLRATQRRRGRPHSADGRRRHLPSGGIVGTGWGGVLLPDPSSLTARSKPRREGPGVVGVVDPTPRRERAGRTAAAWHSLRAGRAWRRRFSSDTASPRTAWPRPRRAMLPGAGRESHARCRGRRVALGGRRT